MWKSPKQQASHSFYVHSHIRHQSCDVLREKNDGKFPRLTSCFYSNTRHKTTRKFATSNQATGDLPSQDPTWQLTPNLE